MKTLLFSILLVFLFIFEVFSDGHTVSGNVDINRNGFYVFDADDTAFSSTPKARERRAVQENATINLNVKIKNLDDRHKQLMVHWVGEGSSVIICLARDPAPMTDILMSPSAVYISYDYGDTYVNQTDKFRLANGNYSTLDKFYNHPKFNTRFIFADVKHKTIWVTADHGKTVETIQVNFSPSDIFFHEYRPATFLVHDKIDPDQRVYLTEDFGKTFKKIRDFVKTLHWISPSDGELRLLDYRLEPSGTGNVFLSKTSVDWTPDVLHDSNVKDLYVKGDYVFTTKSDGKGNVDLYVATVPGKPRRCLFDTRLERRSYFVVDVTDNRALVAVSHGKTVSHLYVSGDLAANGTEPIEFTLSLEDVFCYFPNNTWHDTLMQLMSEETFADVYKVQGLTGIYIASRVVSKPAGNNLGPQNLGSVITFDHGATWRLIRAPLQDNEGQRIACDYLRNCSLHLSQKFNYLYPDTKTISILSSKSAPGFLVATGIIGNSLKGHYGVYVSSDAGWTWRQTLKDLYFFNMGDHGGLLTAVKYYKSKGETRHILYSTDEGEKWHQAAFNNENLRLYGLMTEPGENTTIFTMFGSLPNEHQWIIIKLDLMNVFSYNCSKDDYKDWSPSQNENGRSYVPCVMGQQRTYRRRMAHVNCYSGLDYDAPIKMEPCNCDVLDFECDFGFVRTGKPGHCVRNRTVLIDPYKIPDKCPPGQFYDRTKGYRKISGDVCVDGFADHYLPDRVPCPFDEIPDFLLFAQRERISRLNLVDRNLEELPVKNLKNVIAIDFDMRNNCVYWADIALDVIGRQCLSNGTAPEILVSTDLASIEGMALDWLANALYFVDGTRAKIEMIRTDIKRNGRMRRTILGPAVLKKPRGIALHPRHGYMYWTDWSAENPSVNRADLDGSDVRPLFKRPIVEWPNGIAIDYIAERIYWVDARHDYIASADLHGDDLRYVVRDNEVVSHPFAVAVFKSTMFWDDWKRNAIFGADKDSRPGDLRSLEILQKQLVGLMDLKVYAHGVQFGNNTCRPDSCRFTCVGSPNKLGHSCLCPDGMVETSKGDCACPGNVAPLANGTCPKKSGTCGPEHFACADGRGCVPNGWKCDGEQDCMDGSDESECNAGSCPLHYFVCGDGKCIPRLWRCDFSKDCADGSDEADCPRVNCTKDQFACANGRCIAAKLHCDGGDDCNDNSDELNCSSPEPSVCREDEFKCTGGGTVCIPISWRCDKEVDCMDRSDEMNCGDSVAADCSDGRFFCGHPTNTCIYSTWVCDGEKDCPDGRDEKNCSQTASTTLRPKIPDIFGEENGTCTDWKFKCRNEKCIPYWWKCDESDDCGDGSDELGCQYNHASTSTTSVPDLIVPVTPPFKSCGPNQFQCANGACILNSWLCDGIKDCHGGEDEFNCTRTCDSKYFRCRKDGSCIPKELVCDSKPDCPDGTDESNCDVHLPKTPEAPSCATGYFPCDGRLCLPLASLCDGHIDCPDGFDETNCTNAKRVYQVLQMGADERAINDTNILFYWWLPMPTNVKLDFMPSISRASTNNWKNGTWIDESQYNFANLTPFTMYNMTVYVRNKKDNVIFPPAKFYLAVTREGVPSSPWNVTVKQIDATTVLVSWNQPSLPNGIIRGYMISWHSGDPKYVQTMKLKGSNDTFHVLSMDFYHNATYKFFVTAFNRRHSSARSEVATLVFDKESDLESVANLTVTETTNSSVSLKWDYRGHEPEGFRVDASITDHAYPKLQSTTTNKRSIKIERLSPGVMHQFKIYAYKKHFTGPVTIISKVTEGKPLPEIENLKAVPLEGEPTVVKITWSKPSDERNFDWVYGVYYGTDAADLFGSHKVQTKNLSTVIANLGACEIYTFIVGIVGPVGPGPLSHNLQEVTTVADSKAPPKHLTVVPDGDNPLRMKLEWEPSCSTDDDIDYVIKVYQQVTGSTSYFQIKKVKGVEIQHVFNVSYGGVYNVSVATAVPGARYTPYVVYHAPPLMPPYEVKAFVENNGSFVVYWQERQIPSVVGKYKYQVLVSTGNVLNETTAESYMVDGPPFVYSNSSNNMYTFGVRLVTHDSFKSLLSEHVAVSNDMLISLSKSTVSMGAIAVVGLFVVLLALLGGLFVRHKKLKRSITRFANSHYDTRLGSATFDDNHSLEDEIPRIQGFSDDEPLVIA